MLSSLSSVEFVRVIITSLCFLFTSMDALANGDLSPNQLVHSSHLDYSLQYRVYVPAGIQPDVLLPTLYLTDGQWYINQGHFIEVLDQEIEQGSIEPVVVVFVDNRDPENLSNNRRNDEFFGKDSYVNFYKSELVPLITANYPVSSDRTRRVIGGISFGGMNAAAFGLLAHDTFYGIAMQSPANSFHLEAIRKMYKDAEILPIKLFFSVGTKNDNTSEARKFKRVLKRKGYDMNYIEVPFGHTWDNWRPLMDDMLQTFFAKEILIRQAEIKR